MSRTVYFEAVEIVTRGALFSIDVPADVPADGILQWIREHAAGAVYEDTTDGYHESSFDLSNPINLDVEEGDEQ